MDHDRASFAFGAAAFLGFAVLCFVVQSQVFVVPGTPAPWHFGVAFAALAVGCVAWWAIPARRKAELPVKLTIVVDSPPAIWDAATRVTGVVRFEPPKRCSNLTLSWHGSEPIKPSMPPVRIRAEEGLVRFEVAAPSLAGPAGELTTLRLVGIARFGNDRSFATVTVVVRCAGDATPREAPSAAPASDATCQVCGDPFGHGQVVHCIKCLTAHHADCWRYMGRCSTYACGSTATKPR